MCGSSVSPATSRSTSDDRRDTHRCPYGLTVGKKRKGPTAEEQIEIVCDEIDRRLNQSMMLNAGAFSESAAKFYDGKYAALRELRDWLTA